jgi:hypothetical protein
LVSPTRAALKQGYDKSPVLLKLVLWTRYGAGKLGILELRPMQGEIVFPRPEIIKSRKMGRPIAAILDRHNL